MTERADQDRPRPRRLRVAAYGVCVEDGGVLLSRLSARTFEPGCWTVPGGGVEHGEDPRDAVVREVTEETGLTVRVARLLGLDSEHLPRSTTGFDYHALRVIYAVRVVGGSLRHEVDGTTDRAAWFDLGAVARLDRVSLVDVALRLHDGA